MNRTDVPKYQDMLWPTLKVIERLGGSGTVAEIEEGVAGFMKLTEDVLSIEHTRGTRSSFEYRLAWARTYLKFVGAIGNSERGIWSLTEKGRSYANEAAIRNAAKNASEARRKKDSGEPRTPTKIDLATLEYSDTAEIAGWRDELLEKLKIMKPDAFERLCQRVLRESGFVEVEVLGRSGDEGIDGAGILKLGLLSFHVRFQCKRYKDAVGSGVIRDFRGAFVGRADKGLILTTGRFTADARKEATRDGAPPIDLIDGESFCDLLKALTLGVEIKMVEDVSVNTGFFDQF